jgi:sporulation protein YlmC with PRC-barrel domain
VKATGNANYCVGTTQEFTATKRLFPRVEEAAYTFTVTVKSPVVVSYNGTAKTINNDPITIDASEFTGKSMKDGSALYIGKVGNNVVDDKNYITSVTVAADTKDENSKYIKVLNDDKNDPNYNKFNTTVTYKDAEGNVLYTAAAVEVERVKGIALQSAVTCKVNVTVLDKWGVETVIPVNVTVNPIQ